MLDSLALLFSQLFQLTFTPLGKFRLNSIFTEVKPSCRIFSNLTLSLPTACSYRSLGSFAPSVVDYGEEIGTTLIPFQMSNIKAHPLMLNKLAQDFLLSTTQSDHQGGGAPVVGHIGGVEVFVQQEHPRSF